MWTLGMALAEAILGAKTSYAHTWYAIFSVLPLMLLLFPPSLLERLPEGHPSPLNCGAASISLTCTRPFTTTATYECLRHL